MLLVVISFIILLFIFGSNLDFDDSGFMGLVIFFLLSFIPAWLVSIPFEGSKIITNTTEASVSGFIENAGTGGTIGKEVIYDSTDDDGVHRYYFVKTSADGRTDIDFLSSDIGGFSLNELPENNTGSLSVKKITQSCEDGFNTWMLWKSCGDRDKVIFTVRKGMFKAVNNYNPLASKADYDSAMTSE